MEFIKMGKFMLICDSSSLVNLKRRVRNWALRINDNKYLMICEIYRSWPIDDEIMTNENPSQFSIAELIKYAD